MHRAAVHPLERSLAAPRAARGLVRDLCTGWAPSELVGDVELVVTELVSNAVLHGSGQIVLRLGRHDGTVLVGVMDDGAARPHVTSTHPAVERGRGLALVAAVSRAWGVREAAVGKEVWCVVATDAPAVRTSPA